uniref:divergent PAP2 family protein n=1 Tax=Acetatifactor sp. TaxID=1872090 RepID=UPI004055A8C0
MSFFQELFNNSVLICAISGWFIAQVAKTIIYLIINKQFNAERLIGDGGMPSAHSATVCALATSALMEYGVGSFHFAVTAMLAIIVMHDAMGVRRETGIQAKVLNEIMETFEKMGRSELSAQDKLKEFVGHTPLQVMVGGILGGLIALVMHFTLYAN